MIFVESFASFFLTLLYTTCLTCYDRSSAKIAIMLITVIVFCEKLEQMDDNVDQSLIIGVSSKLLPFLVNDRGEKSYGDREKLTDTKEKWRETRAVYFLSDNRFVRASITRRRNSTSVCEIGLTDFSVRNSSTGRAKARPIQIPLVEFRMT